MTRRFLQHARIDSYGAVFNRTVGPFGPGMNVVYGANEAGKSTLASFVGGVLFGWEDGRSERNTYRPANADRAGALFFAARDAAPDCGAVELARMRNAEGLQGDSALVADIDRETFKTMFSLTSDELRSLKGTPDITAHLLTAGSGTGMSPARALAEIDRRIASCTSRAASATESLVQLDDRAQDLMARIREASSQTARYRDEHRERLELEGRRAQASRQLEELNRRIEQAAAWRARLEHLDERAEQCMAEIAQLKRDEADFLAVQAVEGPGAGDALASLDPAAERALRERLDDLAARQDRAERAVDRTAEDYAASAAAYEALADFDRPGAGARARRPRGAHVLAAAMAAAVLVAAGALLVIQGQQAASAPLTAAGAGLVVAAVALAAVALVVLARPERSSAQRESRLDEAQWDMLQDRRKLEAAREAADRANREVHAALEEAGLQQAGGSLRQARALLDDARDARARADLARQRIAALDQHMARAEAALADLDIERERLDHEAGLRDPLSAYSLDGLVDRLADERDRALEAYQAMNQRYGELTEVLARASSSRDFDALKLEYQQVRTRTRDSKDNLATLLLARRILQESIASWESASQPEVYREAGRLMALITDGRWTQVSLSSEGVLSVTDCNLNVREPRHLSLGTCQQLYLALRIALLENAPNVGTSIPVLADDILVNFDAERRRGAARALAELARTRQVIMFTCHPEVVESVRSADPCCTYIEL